jgi:hypothetical protein
MNSIVAELASPDVLSMTQFGVAGLMGALWWWERRYSRQREDQLTQAHERIVQQREHLRVLIEALEGNTRVISEFTAVQEEILRALREQAPHGPVPQGVISDRS